MQTHIHTHMQPFITRLYVHVGFPFEENDLFTFPARHKRSVEKCCQDDHYLSCTEISLLVVNFEDLKPGKELTIDGVKLKFVEKVEPRGFIFKNDLGDEAILSFNEKTQHLFGTLNTHDGREFEIESCHNGHVFKEIDVASLEPALPAVPDVADQPLSRLKRAGVMNEDNTTIETYSIMFYYTQEFEEITADIEGFVDHIIDITNEGYINSNMPVRVKSFCIEKASLSDATGNIHDFRLMKGSPTATRNTADAAALLVKRGLGYCGIAYFLPAGRDWTFSVTAKGCVSGFTFGHELGHNFGCHHDIYSATNDNNHYSYGYGHHIEKGSQSTGARTILAYGRAGYNLRVNYHSNPSVIFPGTGTPTGVAGVSNNAAVISGNRFIMASNGDESATCQSLPVTIVNGKQLGSITEWGPEFSVKFEINVSDFDNGGLDHPYSDVLHFTATDKTCCDEGDRLPGVFLHRDNRFIIAMWGSFDGGRGNIYYTSGRKEVNRWYPVEIKQQEVKSILSLHPFMNNVLILGIVHHHS